MITRADLAAVCHFYCHGDMPSAVNYYETGKSQDNKNSSAGIHSLKEGKPTILDLSLDWIPAWCTFHCTVEGA